ncbi:MAG: hypothetical protein ACN4GW_13940 [Desulforhopalus sp.]
MKSLNINVGSLFLSLLIVIVLFLSGCANFIVPEVGRSANPEAIIKLDEAGIKDAMWQTDYLTLTYSLSGSGDTLKYSGDLDFHRRLTGTFNVMRQFIFKMSFVDVQGQVISSVDISPRFSVGNVIPTNLEVERSFTRPAGTSGIVFNYYGVFGGDSQDSRDRWEIFHFPFE